MATTEATGWHALPFELRRKILKKVPRAPSFWRDNWPLSNQARFTQTPEIKKAMRMSVYARVCKEWQFIFEEINFRELVLSPSCIREFDLYVRHARRRMVKHIWLRIELPQLYCSACRQYENRSEAVCNSHTFTNAMWEMLKVLSSWPSKGCFGLGDDGPVLELSVHHNATPMRRRMSYPQRQGAGRRARSRSTALAIRRGPEHWTIGSTPLHSRYWSMGRDSFSLAGMAGGDAVALNYDALRPGRARQLPVAPVVKGLIVRRQARRALDVSALCKIAESLPGMDSIGLVHMRRASSSFLDDKYQGYLHRYMQQANLLKTLSIFENYHTEGYSSSSYLENNVTHSIGTALADESRSLENLSIAFVADAAVFFRDFWPAPTNTTTTTTTTTITTTSPPLLDLSRTGVQSLLLSLLPPARRLRSSPLYLDPSSLLPSPHSPSYAAFTEALLSATIQANLSLSTITYKPSWPHLRTLSITSLLLAPPNPTDTANSQAQALTKIADLLVAAASAAALAMPNLQTMEIWNCRPPSVASLFRYRRHCIVSKSGLQDSDYPTISLRSTWGGLSINDRVKAAWDHVGNEHVGRDVRIGEEQTGKSLRPHTFLGHACIVGLLDCPPRVMELYKCCMMSDAGRVALK